MKDYDLKADVEAQFPAVWRKVMSENNATPQSKPQGILLGGQPGAGKSYGTKEIKKRLQNNVLVINGDEFRPYHKHYDEIYQKYGKSASEHTGKFAGEMVGKVRDKAIQERFNVVIEGTFRTTKTPLKEIDNFKKQGYSTSIVICTCPKDISWESTQKRAEAQIEANVQPRYVPKEHHDLVVEQLAKNVKEVFSAGVDRLEIYSRSEKLFDSSQNAASDIEKAINSELNGLNKTYDLSFNYDRDKNAYMVKLNGKSSAEVIGNDSKAFEAIRGNKQLEKYSDEQLKMGVLPKEKGQSRPIDMKIDVKGKEVQQQKSRSSELER